jgi:uncharacterized protein
MARRTKIFFATDLHGSSRCFRKFLNAGPVYKADVLVLGADLAGKAIQSIVRSESGRWRSTFIGTQYDLAEGPELAELERLIEDHGYYPYRAERGELEARKEAGSLDELFLSLMQSRLEGWLTLADERLRPLGLPMYVMLGNDDPPQLQALLDQSPWATAAEGHILRLDDDHELLSWGYSNITPWKSHREQTEEQLSATLRSLAAKVQDPSRSIFNVHVPPLGTGLDEAPVLDDNLRVVQVLGQVKFAAVGSSAVRDVLTDMQPLLGLHGHIHESSGMRRIGRTLAINPGSDYGTGVLNGALVTLEADRIAAHQLVRG